MAAAATHTADRPTRSRSSAAADARHIAITGRSSPPDANASAPGGITTRTCQARRAPSSVTVVRLRTVATATSAKTANHTRASLHRLDGLKTPGSPNASIPGR